MSLNDLIFTLGRSKWILKLEIIYYVLGKHVDVRKEWQECKLNDLIFTLGR